MEVEAAEVEEIIEEVAEAGEVERKGKQRNRRRRTSWTCRNTWTSKSTSSSAEVEKVSLPQPKMRLQISLLLHPVVGTLKGYDQLMNLVLDDVQELLRGNGIL